VQQIGSDVALLRAGGHNPRLEAGQFRRVDLGRFTVAIDINQLRMFGGHSIASLLRIIILDEMIPHVPLPHDASIVGPSRFDLDDVVGPNPGLRCQVWPPSHAIGFFRALGLPRNGENVPVRERLDVVVQKVMLVREFQSQSSFPSRKTPLNRRLVRRP
jgi:hypothetical protein